MKPARRTATSRPGLASFRGWVFELCGDRALTSEALSTLLNCLSKLLQEQQGAFGGQYRFLLRDSFDFAECLVDAQHWRSRLPSERVGAEAQRELKSVCGGQECGRPIKIVELTAEPLPVLMMGGSSSTELGGAIIGMHLGGCALERLSINSSHGICN